MEDLTTEQLLRINALLREYLIERFKITRWNIDKLEKELTKIDKDLVKCEQEKHRLKTKLSQEA